MNNSWILMLKKKLKFIGIGAYKSGTTWLVQCLREHPDVCIPQIKELEYFNKKYKDGKFIYSNYDKGIGWYKEQFSKCDGQASYWGEFSNAYLYDKEAPKLIDSMFPNIKLLLCLRNPVDRAYSGYLWDKLNFSKKRYKGVTMEELKKGDYIELGLYGKYIKNYLRIFEPRNIHTILYDDILENPQEVINGVCEFLDLELFLPQSLNKRINPASKARNRSLTYLFDIRRKLEEKNLGVVIDVLKKIKLYGALQNIYVRINRQPIRKKPLTHTQREELKYLFLNDILETEKLLNIDLSRWK